ncbi:MAG TPA: nitronate monooxygenase [Tepidisphaeraceae bacterium]|nr:nitronate monooxygenase [Tepidisphaeraceae bacterium]
MSQIRIIQGGMGVGVSGWPLANAVARLGQLGVVSGTGLGPLITRRLQLGDPGGHVRRAASNFPFADMASRVVNRYFIEGGKQEAARYALTPLPQVELGASLTELTVLANFVEIFLAREGHAGVVGINYLEKVQIPTLASIFGAMLAGVDYILMGAGIPRFIPGVLDAFAAGKAAELRIDLEGSTSSEPLLSQFDPVAFCRGNVPSLKRPQFLAIVSSATLAMTLARKSNGRVDGFIIEGATAGGHNAPPRGPLQLNERGEPIYGPRDLPDMDKFRELRLPFYMAGGYAEPQKLAEALAAGASGIQVGTAFAFCDESSIAPDIKRQAIELSLAHQADVFTDPAASPTGFPFKVLKIHGTLSDQIVYEDRTRVCDLGYLRRAYQRPDGTIGYRCPAEPVDQYVAKGGNPADTDGRKCICNALFGTLGMGQALASGGHELALVTAGDDVANVSRFIPAGRKSYSAADVVRYLVQ